MSVLHVINTLDLKCGVNVWGTVCEGSSVWVLFSTMFMVFPQIQGFLSALDINEAIPGNN